MGLGKTFIGLMLIERLVQFERKRVALFVPKSARTAVWEPHLKRYVPHVWGGAGDFCNLSIFNHTDLLRGGEFPARLERIREMADAIVIDEAHHFRNPGVRAEEEEERRSRYWQLFDICAGKQVYMLTATPVNNRLLDLQHMIELFSQQDPATSRLRRWASTRCPATSASWRRSWSSHSLRQTAEIERKCRDRPGRVRESARRRGALPRDRRAAQPRLRAGKPEEARRAQDHLPEARAPQGGQLLGEQDLRPPSRSS